MRKVILPEEDYNDGYYHFGRDIEAYPDATVFVVYSRRGPGKTYSALRYAYKHEIEFIYMKRTKHDVEFLMKPGPNGEDRSPYYPINRDFGTKIMPVYDKEYSAFYECDQEGHPEGRPICNVLSLNQIKDIKGFDMTECEWILFDEFIPQPGEIVRHVEGEMLLSIFMTVLRDRIKRGGKPLKLILFANAEEVSTPITRELEIIDDLCACANMKTKKHIIYDEARGGVYHHISMDEIPLTPEEINTGISRFMKGTAWHDKAYGGSFSSNDFSNVQKLSLKHYRPLIQLTYKKKDYFIYCHDNGMHYMCRSKAKCPYRYNLDRENDQKAFFNEMYFDLRKRCIDDKFKFETYMMYDLIIHYKQFFEL